MIDPLDESLMGDIASREHGFEGPLKDALLKLRAQDPCSETGIVGTAAILMFVTPPSLPKVEGGVLLCQDAGDVHFVALAKNRRVASLVLKRHYAAHREGAATLRRFFCRLELACGDEKARLVELVTSHFAAVKEGWTVVPGGFVGSIQRLDEGWWARAYHPTCEAVVQDFQFLAARARVCAFPEGAGLTTGDLSEVLVITCAIDETLLDQAEAALLSSMTEDIRENDKLDRMC